MAVNMRIRCSVCRYVWDRTIYIEDEDIVCPACENTQENFDADELAKIESKLRKQSLFALLSCIGVLGGIGCLFAAVILGEPDAKFSRATLNEIIPPDAEIVQEAAMKVAVDKGRRPDNEVEYSDEAIALAEVLQKKATIIQTATTPNDPTAHIIKNLDEQHEAVLNNRPNPDLLKPKYKYTPVGKITIKENEYNINQKILFGAGLLAMVVGLFLGYPAQSKRWIAEI